MATAGFKFAWLVELLQALDNVRLSKALPAARTSNPDHQIVKQWFSRYESRIPRQGQAAHAFLACLFPERVPRRSHAIKEVRLSAIFGRALGLGATRARRLNAWQESSDKDFASCVEDIMAECEFDVPSPRREVTLEELDLTLSQIAANSAFSSFEIRQQADGRKHDQLLAPILRRLSSCEAKWLVRMILKSYSPVQIPERKAMLQFHFLLPSILAVQDSITAAIDFLGQSDVTKIPHNPEADAADAFRATMLKGIKPRLGIMVKRQPYEKARSIKHCCNMADKRLMSIERKYDGEYCQIHIDRSRGAESCIQIFSKSGKDSTEDRTRLHGAIRDSLLIGRPGCKIKRKCILEGELLVSNRITGAIEPFHKIRRHAMHGRRFLGVETDSPPSVDEHLMIMFYDLLVLDEKVLANAPHHKRRQYLKALVKPIPGMAEIGERELINFGSRRAPEELRALFAKSITNGWEGFVLKGYDDSYFCVSGGPRSIKLKRDYITALGENADLCIIGGRGDPKLVIEFGLHGLSWTTFYLACLENKAEVVRFDGKPRFKIIDTINSHGISRNDVLELNKQGGFVEIPFALEQDEFSVKMAAAGAAAPTSLFRRPIVVEVMGAGFDKNSDCDFYTLRFPRVTRIHLDRDLKDTMTFSELQEMAKANEADKSSIDSQEDAKWIERLVNADGKKRYLVDKSQSTSPGKTPRSPESISISPVPTKTKRPPVSVRADTCELSQCEIEARCNSTQTSASSIPTSGSVVSSRSKRKASHAMTTAHKGAKRQRLTSSQEASEETPLTQDSQVHTMPNLRVLRSGTERGLNSSQKSPGTREPLAEMTPPNIQRRRSPQSRPQADGLDPAKTSGLDKTTSADAGVSTAVREANDTTTFGMPSLLTPPTSSAESTAAEKAKTNRRVQKHQQQNRKVSADASSPAQRDVQTSSKIDLASPMWLGKSLAAKDSSAGFSLPLHQLLQKTTFAFTYSSSCFISHIFRDVGQRHVVLVDASEPNTVAADILELGHQLVNCAQLDTLKKRVVVIFVDSSFLVSTSSSSEKAISAKDLENAFCAALELGPDVVDEQANRAARVAWEENYLN